MAWSVGSPVLEWVGLGCHNQGEFASLAITRQLLLKQSVVVLAIVNPHVLNNLEL